MLGLLRISLGSPLPSEQHRLQAAERERKLGDLEEK